MFDCFLPSCTFQVALGGPDICNHNLLLDLEPHCARVIDPDSFSASFSCWGFKALTSTVELEDAFRRYKAIFFPHATEPVPDPSNNGLVVDILAPRLQWIHPSLTQPTICFIVHDQGPHSSTGFGSQRELHLGDWPSIWAELAPPWCWTIWTMVVPCSSRCSN